MENILVTGGAGFIGSNFIRFLLKEEPEIKVFNIDALTYSSSKENLNNLSAPDRYRFQEGNICNRELIEHVIRTNRIDTVVNFAAETHVDRSIISPGSFITTNIIGTFTLLQAARQVWQKEGLLPMKEVRFHQVSTDEVYGELGQAESAFSESAPYAPSSPYAATKAAGDHIIRAYGRTYGLPINITISSNNYGEYQYPEKLIPFTIIRAMKGEQIPIYGSGEQIRDWIYVIDHCKSILTVLKRGRNGETYNVGGEIQLSNLDLVKKVCSILDTRFSAPGEKPHSSLIEFVEDRPGHDSRYGLDISKIKEELGWIPLEPFDRGLRVTVEWYLNQSDWISLFVDRPAFQEWVSRNYNSRNMET